MSNFGVRGFHGPDAAVDDWRERAACRPGSGVDLDSFFPVSKLAKLSRAAKVVCGECPTVADCLIFALEREIPTGIFGGRTPEERKKMRLADVQAASRVRVLPPCPARKHLMDGANTARSSRGAVYCRACKRENGIAAAARQAAAAERREARTCWAGHLLAGTNLNKLGKCRTCSAARSAKYREKRAAELAVA